MEDKIYLKENKKLTDEEYGLIYQMMIKEPGIFEIFRYSTDRLEASVVYSLIINNNIPIGFLNITKENINDILFVDIGIKQDYRGKGYTKKALENLLKRINCDEYLIAETKKNNLPANKSLIRMGNFVCEFEDNNYYLLQKERKEEFLESEIYNSFIDYVRGDKPKQREFIRQNIIEIDKR